MVVSVSFLRVHGKSEDPECSSYLDEQSSCSHLIMLMTEVLHSCLPAGNNMVHDFLNRCHKWLNSCGMEMLGPKMGSSWPFPSMCFPPFLAQGGLLCIGMEMVSCGFHAGWQWKVLPIMYILSVILPISF